MIPVPDRLSDLKRVSWRDQDLFVRMTSETGQIGWLYYFPFLELLARADAQTLLWEIHDGALCLYRLRHDDDAVRLHLYLPPFPNSDAALIHAVERVRAFTGKPLAHLEWADGRHKDWVRTMGFETRPMEEEFIYDTALVQAAAGKDFERLRKEMNRARRVPGLEVRDFRRGDEDDCWALMRQWQKAKQAHGLKVGLGYKRRCLERAFAFGEQLQGEVVTVDGRICALTFGGAITASHGNIFIAISNNEVPGVAYLQRHHFMAQRRHIAFFNDSTNVFRSGLTEVKRAFRPVAMNTLYAARIKGTVARATG